MNESRTRLAKLRPLVAEIDSGRAAQVAVPLITATAAITSFDEAVATPEQKDVVAKARAAAKPLAWALLQERVNALATGDTPEADQAVAGVSHAAVATQERDEAKLQALRASVSAVVKMFEGLIRK